MGNWLRELCVDELVEEEFVEGHWLGGISQRDMVEVSMLSELG